MMKMDETEDIIVSVVVANHSEKEYLEQVLYSLRVAIGGRESQIFVVDNHSVDDSVASLKSDFPEVSFVENPDSLTFTALYNRVLQQCSGEYVLLLRSDTIIGEEGLFSLMFHLDDHPEIGAVGVKMIDGNGVYIPKSKRTYPTAWSFVSDISGVAMRFSSSLKYARCYMPELDANRSHKVDVLSDAFLLVRREVFDKVGYFDEAYSLFGAEIDFSYRILKAGYENHYIPERVLWYQKEYAKSSVNDKRAAILSFFLKLFPQASSFSMKVLKLSLKFKSLLNAFLGGGKKNKPYPHRRILVFAREANFEMVKKEVLQKMPSLQYVNLWNLDDDRVLDALCRKVKMKQFTDMVFYYPDVRYEQMLLFMDQMPDKRLTYHIYNSISGKLISPK